METTIKATNLTKSFGDFTAVDKLNFEVEKGEIFGFLGANGAGKTTAMKMLIGISKPTAGDAMVANYKVSTQADLVKKNIGYMSQKFALYDDLNIKENIQFFGGIYGLNAKTLQQKYQQVVENLGLENYVKQLVKNLPLGLKQKLAFSVALLHQPKVVFLDEPTGGVDPITRRQFWELIYEAADRGTTIFVTTHYMDEAEYCDRISMMVDGKIKALDTPKALKKEFGAETLNEVFLNLAR
ncbi:ABC transporter ATP-binding protein [Psychroflexus salinarum]|uniref:ABC transporter ATP-binding protein n=2 Tax=Psychroflexus TaxID=83612 RepID=A0ABW3GR66_9FLAO|nr:ABC transporter ATP-binding protein [Psychroflexus longus]MBZ9778462.1 ABC transporter ATP-binding protein [Psychroflexus longus]